MKNSLRHKRFTKSAKVLNPLKAGLQIIVVMGLFAWGSGVSVFGQTKE